MTRRSSAVRRRRSTCRSTSRCSALQRGVLDTLMSPPIAQRLLNNAAKVDDPKQALKLSELYATLHDAVWSELKSGKDITLFRRNLQREYATRVANALLRPTASDARGRAGAAARRCIAVAQRSSRAHDRVGCRPKRRRMSLRWQSLLDEAQKAPIVRQAV